MNTFIFVSVICISQNCAFFTSPTYLSEKKCNEYKQEFLQKPFKSEVTLAAYQCMKFEPGEQV